MDTAPSTPDADVIYDLYKGDYKVQLVRIALRLDVFAPLATGATDAETVARACSCAVKGMRALLEYLHSIHLLIKEGNTYALTPSAATFLVPGTPGYAGELLLMETDPQLWEGVLQALRSGQPVHPSVPWEQDAWLESYRAWRPAQSLEMWRAAGIAPGHRPGLRVLDVACGCAIKSFVLPRPTQPCTSPAWIVPKCWRSRVRWLSDCTYCRRSRSCQWISMQFRSVQTSMRRRCSGRSPTT